MMKLPLMIADLFSPSGLFGDFNLQTPGMIAAGVIFLVLLITGIIAWVVVMKAARRNPADWQELARRIAERSLRFWIIFLLVLLLAGLFFAMTFIYRHYFAERTPGPRAILVQAAVFHLPFLLLLPVILKFSGAGKFFGGRSPKFIFAGILFYLAMLPPLWLFNMMYQVILYFLGQDISLQDITVMLAADAVWPVRVLLFLSAIIIAPVFEEVIFRGILLPVAIRYTGKWLGIILISLIFGALHFHLPSFGALVLLSVALSLAAVRTGSLLVPITMHAVFNGITMILLMIIS
ncbi:MAG: CPBP family intramembrane glutamic endopeptidase [Kiritimatiellales bacterium]